MRAAVALIKILLLPVFAMAFFGGFSMFVVMPLMDLIPANPNNSMTGILLSSVVLNFILIALAASIMAFPVAYIYKKYAPLAALVIYAPILFFSITAFTALLLGLSSLLIGYFINQVIICNTVMWCGPLSLPIK